MVRTIFTRAIPSTKIVQEEEAARCGLLPAECRCQARSPVEPTGSTLSDLLDAVAKKRLFRLISTAELLRNEMQ